MAGLYEEKDLQAKPVEASTELNLGQRTLQKYTENFDFLNERGYTPERVFNALYKRDSASLASPVDAETWAKQNGMDKFLSDAGSFTKTTLQSRQDEKTRADNLQNMGDVERGLRGYTHSTIGLAAAFGALGAKKLLPGKWGEDIALSLYDTYKEQERKASLYPTKSIISEKEGEWFDFSQIQSPGDVVDFIQGVAGETVPTMAYIAASSLVGAALGTATAGPAGTGAGAISGLFNGMTQKVSKKFIAKQMEHLMAKNVSQEAAEVIARKTAARMAGGAVGMSLGSFSLEAGSGFTNAVEHFSQKFIDEGMDPGEARLHAMDKANGLLITTMATAGSLVEHLGGSSRLLKKVLGPGASEAAEEVIRIAKATRANPEILGRVLNVGKGLLLEAAKQAPAEFGQEALQEILGMANIEFTDPDFQIMSQENLKGYLDAGIAGAVGGVATGMATRVTGSAREVMGIDEKPNVAEEIKLLQRKIQNQEEILAKDPASFPGIQVRLEQNRRDLEALSGYAKIEDAGLSYADAAARINEESPSPDGKTFGVRQLKNMLRDGRIKKLDEGTVDRTSLETFLEGRKAKAEGVDPATATRRTMEVEAAGQARHEAAAAADQAQQEMARPGTLGGKSAPKAEAAKATADMTDEERAIQQLEADQEAQRLAFEQEQKRLATGADETPVVVDEEPPAGTKAPGSLLKKGYRIAGGKYSEVQDEAERARLLAPGAEVDLVRDPENPHDKNAIKIVAEGKHVGYLPAEDVIELASQFDDRSVSSLKSRINDQGRVDLNTQRDLGANRMPEEPAGFADNNPPVDDEFVDQADVAADEFTPASDKQDFRSRFANTDHSKKSVEYLQKNIAAAKKRKEKLLQSYQANDSSGQAQLAMMDEEIAHLEAVAAWKSGGEVGPAPVFSGAPARSTVIDNPMDPVDNAERLAESETVTTGHKPGSLGGAATATEQKTREERNAELDALDSSWGTPPQEVVAEQRSGGRSLGPITPQGVAVKRALEANGFKFSGELGSVAPELLHRVVTKRLHGSSDKFADDAAEAIGYMLVKELGLPERSHDFRKRATAITKKWIETGKLPDSTDTFSEKIVAFLNRLLDAILGISKDDAVNKKIAKRLRGLAAGQNFSFEPAAGRKALSFQQVYDASPGVEDIFAFARETDGVLTGSFAYMDQAKVYRTPGQPTHDIDLVYKSGEGAKSALAVLEKKGGVKLYQLKLANGDLVVGVAVPPNGYSITNASSTVESVDGKYINQRSYDVVDKNGVVVGGYRWTKKDGKETESFSGNSGIIVDLIPDKDFRSQISQTYVDSSGKKKTINVSSYVDGFAAKLETLRYKDIQDFGLLEGKDVKVSSLNSEISDPGYHESLIADEEAYDPGQGWNVDDFERTMERVEFFKSTLKKYLGEDVYKKLVDYNLINIDRLARYNPAVYMPRARMAVFDPEQMETEQAVLAAFYHEVGVHHGLETLILKHSRPQSWNNFRRSFIKELTGKGPVSNDGLMFREAYERAKELYIKSPNAAKRFGALDGMSIKEQMEIDYFFHEFLGQLSDMTDWTKKKQPSWATWLRDRLFEFFRALGFQVAPTFEQVGSLIQGSVAHIIHAENIGIKSDRLLESSIEAINKGLGDDAAPAYVKHPVAEEAKEWQTLDAAPKDAVKLEFVPQRSPKSGAQGSTFGMPYLQQDGKTPIPAPGLKQQLRFFLNFAVSRGDLNFVVESLPAEITPALVQEVLAERPARANVFFSPEILGKEAKPAPAAQKKPSAMEQAELLASQEAEQNAGPKTKPGVFGTKPKAEAPKALNISSYETGLGKKLSNFEPMPIVFNGKKYARSEDAYQEAKKTLPDLSDKSVQDLMVRILVAKLEQHPELLEELQGGKGFEGGWEALRNASHDLIKNGKVVKSDRWTGKDGLFMLALKGAYNELWKRSEEAKAPKAEAPKVEAPKVEAPKVEAPKATSSATLIPMTYMHDPQKGFALRDDVLEAGAEGTFDAIALGKRTGTTRVFKDYLKQFADQLADKPQLSASDIDKMTGQQMADYLNEHLAGQQIRMAQDQKIIMAEVTEFVDAATLTPEQWSEVEGWDQGVYHKAVVGKKAPTVQMRFKVLETKGVEFKKQPVGKTVQPTADTSKFDKEEHKFRHDIPPLGEHSRSELPSPIDALRNHLLSLGASQSLVDRVMPKMDEIQASMSEKQAEEMHDEFASLVFEPLAGRDVAAFLDSEEFKAKVKGLDGFERFAATISAIKDFIQPDLKKEEKQSEKIAGAVIKTITATEERGSLAPLLQMFFEPPAREAKQKKNVEPKKIPVTTEWQRKRELKKSDRKAEEMHYDVASSVFGRLMKPEEIVEKIRALPQRKRMRLLSLVDKTAHKAALSEGYDGIAKHAKRLKALAKSEAIYEPALTGELEGFLNSVADYMQMVGSQRGNDKHRIEQIKNAFSSASDVVSAIAKKDSPIYVRMLETFGTDFKSYAGALWAAKRELSELHDNLIADRRLLRKDRLISWVKGITLPEFDPRQHRHLVTVSDPNLRRLASAQAYIDENIAAVRRAMDTHSVYGYLSADAKDLFAKMIGGFSTARAYSGRTSEARREKFSGMVANLSALDLAGHLSGVISPQDAAILVEALSENQKTEQAIVDELMEQYRLAEQMKSDAMLTSAVTGPGHVKSTADAMKMVAAARSVKASSLANFRSRVVTALEGTLGRLVASGAITEADAAEMRASWSGRASKKNSADLRNYEQGTDTENSQFHRHISQTLTSLSEKLGASITVATSLFPAVSSGEVQRLESIAAALNAEAQPGSAMAQLYPEEIFLGLVGFGLRNSERGMNEPAYSGIPTNRLSLLADAGFMSSEGKSFYPISGEFKVREIKAFQRFSLFQQMELSVNSRAGSFFSDGEVSDFVPADGRFIGLRRFGPGSMLYDRKTKEFLFVGGRNTGSVGGKTVQGYSLLRTQMNGDRVTLDYVRDGDPKRGPVKLHSFEDIAAQNLTVVPNLWGLMPGATSFESGEFGMFQDYDILNGQKAIRRKIEVNGVLERNRKARLSRPVYAEIVKDAAGQSRLVTYDGDSNEKVLAIRDASSNLQEDRAVQLALSHISSALRGNKEVRELLAQARELNKNSSPDRVAWIHGRLLETLEYELQRTGVADAVSPDVMNRLMMMVETTLDAVIEEAMGVQEEVDTQSEFDSTEVIDQSIDEADAMEAGDKDPQDTQGKQTQDQLMESAEDMLVEDMLFAENGSDLATQRDLAVEDVMNAVLPADTFKSAWRGVLAHLPHAVKGRLNDKLKAAKITSDMSINDLLYDGHPEIALHLLSALSQYAPKALGLSRAAARVAYGVKGIEIASDHILGENREGGRKYADMDREDQMARRSLLSLTGVLHHYLAAYRKFASKKIRSAAKNPWSDPALTGDALAKAIEAAGLTMNPGTVRAAWNGLIAGRSKQKGLSFGDMLYKLATADIPFDLIHAASGADTQSLKEQWTRGIYEDRSRESSGFVNQQSLYPGEFQETLQGHLVQAIIEKFGAIPGPRGEIATKLDENPTLANAIDLLSEVVDDVDDELMAIARAYLSGEDGSFDEKNAGAETVDDLSYFVGVDNIGYNIITEQEAAANREEYPPLRSQSISGMELKLLSLIDEIAPGTYRISGYKAARDGRSATIKINDEEVAVEFGETVYVGEFGAALLQQARSIIEHAHVPGAMNQEARQRLLAAVAEFSGYENMYGPGSTARLLNARTRAGKTMHKLDVRKMPAWDKILVKARELLSEITVFGKVPPRVILHAPNETGWGFVSNFETKGLLSAADAQFLKFAPEHIAREHFQRVMGLVDRNGVIHVFLGQHATKDGKFDWDEFYRTVYHEGIGHLGLRKALGEAYDDFLVGVFNSHLKTDQNAHFSRESRIQHAEEWMAGKAEQVRMDAAAGRPVNKHIGTLLDRVATMVVKAFRKIMDKLGFKGEPATTSFEVRDALARAFKGSRVGGRTGFSSLLPPGMVTGENLVRYESFGSEYQANTADTLARKSTDYLRPWEMLSRSLLNFGIDIKASENFMYGLRTQKSRIGGLVKNTKKYREEFVRILKDTPFGVEEVSNFAHALHALERNSAGVGEHLARRTAAAEARLQEKIDAGEFTKLDGTLDEKTIAAERKKLEGRKAVRDNAIRRLVKEGNFNQLSGMSTNDANALIADMLAKGYIKEDGNGGYTGKMMDAVNKLVETNALALDMMAASGLITSQARDGIKEMYRYYVPIPGKPEPALGRQFIDMQAGNRFKQAQGVSMVYDQGQLEDTRTVAGVTFSGLNARIAEMGMNETNQTLLELTKNHSNPELFQAFLPDAEFDELKLHLEALRAVKVDEGQVSDTAMNERGFFRMPATAGMNRKTLKEFEAENGYIPVYVGGQVHYLRVLNKDLKTSLDQLNNPVEAGRVMRMLGHVTRYLVKVNVSMNPEFFMSNMVRDIGSAFNTLAIRQNISGLDGYDFAKKVVGKVIPAMAVIKARNFGGKRESLSPAQQKLWDLYDDFEASGGKIQWAFLETAEETMSSLTEAVRVMQGKGSAKEKTKAFYDKVEDLFQRSADIFENSTRLSIFATAIEAGASRQEAALMARETTVDFDRKGEMGQALNTLYMFANAGIQGSLTVLRTMMRNPGRAAKHVGAIVGFSLSLALLNAFAGGSGDDDEPLFFGISEETRNTHMVFMLPGLDQGLKIPLPWVYAFFWSIGQQLASMAMGRASATTVGANLIGAGLNNFNPLESAASLSNAHGWVRMLTPTIVDPLVDIGFEKTPFGTPLMPEKVYEDQPDSARHWRSVSGPSKAVADFINNDLGGGSAGVPGLVSISPETLDLLFEQATGGLGRLVTRSISSAMSPVSGKEMTMNDIPVARRFFAGVGPWEDRNRFKSIYDEIHGVNRTMKNLQDNARLARDPELRKIAMKDVQAFREENKDILAMRVSVNRVYSRVKAIDEQKKALYKSGLPESEVNPKLRALDERQREIFTTFNRMYREKVDR